MGIRHIPEGTAPVYSRCQLTAVRLVYQNYRGNQRSSNVEWISRNAFQYFGTLSGSITVIVEYVGFTVAREIILTVLEIFYERVYYACYTKQFDISLAL